MSLGRRSLWISALFGIGVLVAKVIENWLWSRMDDAVTERQRIVIDAGLFAVRWGMAHPLTWVAIVLCVGLLFIWLVLFVERAIHRSHVSIEGIDSYMIRHRSGSDRYIIASDVTIVNHRHDRNASLRLEYRYDESVRYKSDDGSEKVHHFLQRCKPENSPVPGWSNNKTYFKRNAPMAFPMLLSPGEAKMGYIAFRIGEPKLEAGYMEARVDSESGTVVFIDNIAGKEIKTLQKEKRLFLG